MREIKRRRGGTSELISFFVQPNGQLTICPERSFLWDRNEIRAILVRGGAGPARPHPAPLSPSTQDQ